MLSSKLSVEVRLELVDEIETDNPFSLSLIAILFTFVSLKLFFESSLHSEGDLTHWLSTIYTQMETTAKKPFCDYGGELFWIAGCRKLIGYLAYGTVWVFHSPGWIRGFYQSYFCVRWNPSFMMHYLQKVIKLSINSIKCYILKSREVWSLINRAIFRYM